MRAVGSLTRWLVRPSAGAISVAAVLLFASCQKSGQRYVIIHADDAGMCESVNRATIEAAEAGLVSSVSIMVPCPAFESFAEYASAHPEQDFGVHLVLNSEWDEYRWGPVAPADQVPSLVDEDGYLWKSGEQVRANVRVEEAEIELRAQIERAKAFGIHLSHLDSHMFSLALRPDLLKLYAKLGVEYDLPVLFPRTLDARQLTRNAHLADLHPEMVRILDKNRLPLVDAVDSASYGVPARRKREHYLQYVRELDPGVTELIIHCGMNDVELARITTSAGRRYADFQVFTSQEMARELRELGVHIIDWKTLRAMAQIGKGCSKPRAESITMAPLYPEGDR